jgi:hypothetical protein
LTTGCNDSKPVAQSFQKITTNNWTNKSRGVTQERIDFMSRRKINAMLSEGMSGCRKNGVLIDSECDNFGSSKFACFSKIKVH